MIDKRSGSCYINVIASRKSCKHLKKQKKIKKSIDFCFLICYIKGALNEKQQNIISKMFFFEILTFL